MVFEERKLEVANGRPTVAQAEDGYESVLVSFTVTRAMKRAAAERAKEQGQSFSAYLRELIKEDLKQA